MRPQGQLALGTSCRSISADFGAIVGAPRGKDGHRAHRPAELRTSGPETTPQETSSAVSVFKLPEGSASSPEPSAARTEGSASSPEPSAARTFIFGFGHIFVVAAVVLEAELICSVVLISGAQQSDAVNYVYSFPASFRL